MARVGDHSLLKHVLLQELLLSAMSRLHLLLHEVELQLLLLGRQHALHLL